MWFVSHNENEPIQALYIILLASSTTLLTVSVDVSRRVLTCQFADVTNISCSIHYRNDPGCVQNNGTDMNSASSGTVLILTLPEDLIENGLHCYTVTASSGGQTVKVVGEFRTGIVFVCVCTCHACVLLFSSRLEHSLLILSSYDVHCILQLV